MLSHQRRASGPQGGVTVADADHFNHAAMPVGQQVKLDLGPNTTKRIFLALIGRYKSAGTYDHIMADTGATVVDGTDVSVRRSRCFEIPATCQVTRRSGDLVIVAIELLDLHLALGTHIVARTAGDGIGHFLPRNTASRPGPWHTMVP